MFHETFSSVNRENSSLRQSFNVQLLKMVRHNSKFLQQMLQDFKNESVYFWRLCFKGLIILCSFYMRCKSYVIISKLDTTFGVWLWPQLNWCNTNIAVHFLYIICIFLGKKSHSAHHRWFKGTIIKSCFCNCSRKLSYLRVFKKSYLAIVVPFCLDLYFIKMKSLWNLSSSNV